MSFASELTKRFSTRLAKVTDECIIDLCSSKNKEKIKNCLEKDDKILAKKILDLEKICIIEYRGNMFNEVLYYGIQKDGVEKIKIIGSVMADKIDVIRV